MVRKKHPSVYCICSFGAGVVLMTVLLFAAPVRAGTVLDVPFSIQIPNGAWVQPFKDACEEASLLMASAFYSHTGFADKKDARKKIQALVDLEDKVVGFDQDTDAEVMTRMINDFLPFEARIVDNPTVEMIKKETDVGRLVIVPANGRLLPNPYFKSPGPLYHVVVIVGYDDTHKEFITNDPATRHGKNFRYAFDTLMQANADWAPDLQGARAKKMIFTSPILTNTAASDADHDGLSKKDEIAHGTSLYVADTDGDGFDDGVEAAAGYTPLVAENKLQKPILARAQGMSKVYWIADKKKHHVLSPAVMKSRGWRWSDVHTVSAIFLNGFQEGEPET